MYTLICLHSTKSNIFFTQARAQTQSLNSFEPQQCVKANQKAGRQTYSKIYRNSQHIIACIKYTRTCVQVECTKTQMCCTPTWYIIHTCMHTVYIVYMNKCIIFMLCRIQFSATRAALLLFYSSVLFFLMYFILFCFGSDSLSPSF